MSTPTTAPRPSTTRRLALLALGLLVVLTGLGLGSAPASAFEPNPPVDVLAAGYERFIRVYVIPPTWEDPDAPVTGYTIERHVQGQVGAPKVWHVADVAPLVDTTAVIGTTYTYRARANSADGPSEWSDTSAAKRSIGVEEWDKLSTAGFVDRQYQDLLGRNPTPAERGNATYNLDQGAWTAGSFLNQLVFRPERAPRHQVIRLYNAYFDRNADHAGLAFWYDQITEHGKSINTVSSSFAGSAEFAEMYGDLTNAQYVTLVYQNVLDRNPKPADLAYWKGRLDAKEISRGRMMTLFSESAEFKALSRGRVLAADVHDAMLGATSKGSELAHWSSHIQEGGNAGDYGTRLMLLNAY
ncbi:MAG TPA: DUF4214 domain-containing protein [Iamia sp.]|nr:DUF4214 domain-containing protein [Iamia sp.]